MHEIVRLYHLQRRIRRRDNDYEFGDVGETTCQMDWIEPTPLCKAPSLVTI